MRKVFGILLGIAIIMPATMSRAAELTIVHTDPAWKDGKGDVPEKGICLKHDGKSWSPSLKISGIPSDAKSIRLLFTDDDFGDEGGHGDFTIKLNGQGTLKIPSIGGDKDFLPKNVIGGNGHHCDSCSEKDYLGPCSGGRGNTYRVNIYAKDKDGKDLAKGTILLGNF